ncbi:MAG: BspA family leucine-rich repeat surface protein [Lachnospiraceae bacterium]|nr:BspA family leucine-rich repeat surface protein [Lachnospiraceae bacterium]
MPTSNVTVTAVFELDAYTITVSDTSGCSSSVSSPTVGSFSTTSGTAVVGETVTVTITRSSGHGKLSLSVAGQSVVMDLSNDDSTYTYQFTMPQNSVAVEMYATWSSGATGVTVNSMSHGSVTGSSLSSKAPDSTVELTVTPDAGYRLGTISVAKVSTTTTSVAAADLLITPTLKNGTTNVYTFTMPPTDATVSATFVKAVTGVTLNSTAETIDVDEDVTLIATVAPTDAANKNVTWSSGDEDVATVTQNATNGLVATVTGVSAGTTDITVTTEDGSFTATCVVTVSAPAVTLTIDCGTGGTATASPTTPQAGDTVVLTITPNSGKMPVVAIADAGGQSIAVTENGTFSFTMPARSVTATVTFVNTKMYYTSNDSTHTITIYRTQDAQNTREEIADWYEFPSTYGADSVVFAEAVYPTSTEQWFSAGTCEIENIENLHTENVTSMKEMFKDFEGMTTLDLSSFDTSGVTDMSGMFQSCTASTIDVSSFDTSAVVDMQAMLYDCNAVVDISGFDTSSVENMSQMFGQWASGDLDLTNFDTSSVTTMFGMFEDCSTLTSLDLSSFDTANVTDMACMFDGRSALTMITVSDSFDVTNVEDSGDMFAGCTALTGGNGTQYNESHIDISYARLDGGPGSATPGYFTAVGSGSGGTTGHSLTAAGNLSANMTFYVDDSEVTEADEDDRVEIHIPQTAFGSGEVLMSLSINSGAVMAHLDFTQFPGVNGNESGTDFVYWFTMPDADATVTATKDSPEYGLPDYISYNLPYGYNGTYAENGIGVMMGATDTAASLINGGYNSVDGVYGYEFSVSSYDLMFGSRYDFVIEVPDGCSITSISGESDYLHYEAIDETHYAGYLTVPEVEEDYIWLVVTLNE